MFYPLDKGYYYYKGAIWAACWFWFGGSNYLWKNSKFLFIFCCSVNFKNLDEIRNESGIKNKQLLCNVVCLDLIGLDDVLTYYLLWLWERNRRLLVRLQSKLVWIIRCIEGLRYRYRRCLLLNLLILDVFQLKQLFEAISPQPNNKDQNKYDRSNH